MAHTLLDLLVCRSSLLFRHCPLQPVFFVYVHNDSILSFIVNGVMVEKHSMHLWTLGFMSVMFKPTSPKPEHRNLAEDVLGSHNWALIRKVVVLVLFWLIVFLCDLFCDLWAKCRVKGLHQIWHVNLVVMLWRFCLSMCLSLPSSGWPVAWCVSFLLLFDHACCVCVATWSASPLLCSGPLCSGPLLWGSLLEEVWQVPHSVAYQLLPSDCPISCLGPSRFVQHPFSKHKA